MPAETREAYIQADSFKGPLPPPTLFEHYDKILPEAAERLVRMTEKEQSHRQEWEMAALNAQKSDVRRGQWMGFMLGLAGIAVALVCAFLDRPYIASASPLTVLAGITASFFSKRPPPPTES